MKIVFKFILKAGVEIIKIILLVLIILILAPIGFFVWRAGQPMNMSEYDDRTYYQLLSERSQAYIELAQEYQANHPSADVKRGMCFQTELVVSFANTLPWAGICAASEYIPALRIYGPKSQQMGCGQMDGMRTEFFDTWWRTFEKLLYTDIICTRPQGPVPYCRLSAP